MDRNLLKNGDFETPRVRYGWTDVERGGGEFAWIVSKERVEMKAGVWDGAYDHPQATKGKVANKREDYHGDGNQSVDMDFNAVMYQGISTKPGTTYRIGVWYSHNPNIGNKSSSGIIRVVGKTKLIENRLTHDLDSDFGDMKFQRFVASFTADSRETRIEFESLQPHSQGFVIDGVRVTESLPK